MITREELYEVKEKRRTTLYYAEKEYLQYIFLNALSKHADDFAFKGGTCLRICYGLERASEDIDFSTSLDVKEIKKIVIQCLHDVGDRWKPRPLGRRSLTEHPKHER